MVPLPWLLTDIGRCQTIVGSDGTTNKAETQSQVRKLSVKMKIPYRRDADGARSHRVEWCRRNGAEEVVATCTSARCGLLLMLSLLLLLQRAEHGCRKQWMSPDLATGKLHGSPTKSITVKSFVNRSSEPSPQREYSTVITFLLTGGPRRATSLRFWSVGFRVDRADYSAYAVVQWSHWIEAKCR